MADHPDIVYVVRRGDFNDELRFSLRSLANIPHGRVWCAGYRPRWCSDRVGFIPARQGATKYKASTANLLAAASDDRVSDDFLYFNDDFFVMGYMESMPVYHRGLVTEVLADYEARHNRGGQYMAGMRQTAALLDKLGHPDPLSYELHLPLPVTKEQVKKVCEVGHHIQALHKRTLLGNLFNLGGERTADVKVTRLDGGYERGLFLSTTNRSFQKGDVGRTIREAFPDPCQYERPEPGRRRR